MMSVPMAQSTRRRGSRGYVIPIVNDTWHDMGGALYLFSFGAYGGHDCYAWGERSLDDALEAAAEWLGETAPGLFSEPDYADAARELGAPEDWADDEEWFSRVSELAERDHTYTEAGWLLSWEWSVREITDADEYATVKARSIASVEGE